MTSSICSADGRWGAVIRNFASHVVWRLREQFAGWRVRDSSKDLYPNVFLDGTHLMARTAHRFTRVPVLMTLGVIESRGRLVGLNQAVNEASAHWSSLAAEVRLRRHQAGVTRMRVVTP